MEKLCGVRRTSLASELTSASARADRWESQAALDAQKEHRQFGDLPVFSQDDELERVKGIEPSYEAWEAAVLPLNYTRLDQEE